MARLCADLKGKTMTKSVFHDVELLDLRDETPPEFPDGRPWMVVSAENHAVYCATEEEACALQRHWRALHGKDEMTGGDT